MHLIGALSHHTDAVDPQPIHQHLKGSRVTLAHSQTVDQRSVYGIDIGIVVIEVDGINVPVIFQMIEKIVMHQLLAFILRQSVGDRLIEVVCRRTNRVDALIHLFRRVARVELHDRGLIVAVVPHRTGQPKDLGMVVGQRLDNGAHLSL